MLDANKMLSYDERRELTAEKYELVDKNLKARSDGERDRLYKQITDIQKQLDDDVNERTRTGFDEARDAAMMRWGGSINAAHRDSDPELRAFATPGHAVSQYWVKPPREMTIGTPDKFAQRTAFLTTDTATIGSNYYFTTSMYKEIIAGLLEASGVLEAQPTMVVTDHLRTIQLPVLTADAVASAGTEGSPATETNPTGSHIDLGAYRFDGKFTVSLEMLMASELNLEEMLSTFAVRSLANKTAAMYAIGNGATEPLGAFTSGAVTVGKTGSAQTSLSINELIEAVAALPKGYRKNAKVVVSDVLRTSMLQERDDAMEYILGTVDGGGNTFMGYPLIAEPWADQTAISAAEVHAVAGMWDSFFVRVSPMLFVRSDEDPLNPTFHFAVWTDSAVADAAGLVSLKSAA